MVRPRCWRGHRLHGGLSVFCLFSDRASGRQQKDLSDRSDPEGEGGGTALWAEPSGAPLSLGGSGRC